MMPRPPCHDPGGWPFVPLQRPKAEAVDLEIAISGMLSVHRWPVLREMEPVEPYSWNARRQQSPLRCLSLDFRQRETPRTRSFRFPHPSDAPSQPWMQPPPPDEKARAMVRTSTVGQPTRVHPPGDVVKLEDRLRYVLQPPLESWVATGNLDFPCEPFPYQWHGVAFLYPRHAAILADEMGLGKTMQAITAMRLLMHAGEIRQVLLICPKPLVVNWQHEFSQWAPEMPVVVVEGDPLRRRWLWGLADVPVLIANYELLLRDREELLGRSERFDLVVLDEAQRIKNRSASTSRVACSIQRERSWLLTGTPVENSAEDLVGLFDFLSPGYLSPDMKLRRMGRMASDYIIRRTKGQVLDELPPKLFRDATLHLGPQQRASYDLAEKEGVLRLSRMEEAVSIQHVFELVLRLKQICNFDPATGESVKFERLAADLEEVLASGQRALVFSQWVHTLRELRRRLAHFRPLEFHGQIAGRARTAALGQFREDPTRRLMLLSYGAGGVGLNLQMANYVFLFDRWWNPAVEDQAINRAHRIGSQGPVTVTRFLIAGTIEERIEQVLNDKRDILASILSAAKPHRQPGLSRREIFSLFDLSLPGERPSSQGREAA